MQRVIIGGRTGQLIVIAVALTALQAPADGADPARGRTVFAQAAGCGCHTASKGPVGGGGGEVPTPFGTFYGPNITPDPDTGIGRWSDADIDAAIRRGVRRGGDAEAPAMPYYQYAGMSDADAADLIAFLRSLPPVRQVNRPHATSMPFAGLAYRAWRWLFVPPVQPPSRPPSAEVALGGYLVNHVSICTDCHTPRTWLGVPDSSQYLAGAAAGPGGKHVANITPHATGIGDWDVADIVAVLTTGMLPNFDNVQGFMADVVEGHGGGPGYKDMPESDKHAIAVYLKSVTPVDNPLGRK